MTIVQIESEGHPVDVYMAVSLSKLDVSLRLTFNLNSLLEEQKGANLHHREYFISQLLYAAFF